MRRGARNLGLLAGVAGVLAQPPIGGAAELVTSGAELFGSYCTNCHAEGAAGAVDLSIGPVAARSNHELAEIIGDGRRELGMPSFRESLTNHEILLLVGHLRELQGRPLPIEPPAAPPEEPKDERFERGRSEFFGAARCSECHSHRKEGGRQASDLTDVGGRLTRAQIRRAIREPSAAIEPGYAAVELALKDGRRVRGRARKVTAGSIQLLDESGLLWTTYLSHDVTSVERDLPSLMPEGLLDPLDATQIGDLLYFLTR